MVYHDQNGVISLGGGEVSDQIHGDLLKGTGAVGGDGGQGGVGRMGIHFVGLADSTAGDKFADECGHAQPPVILLEERDGSEIATVGTSERFMDVFY